MKHSYKYAGLVALVLTWAVSGPASAERKAEIGGFAGYHLFNADNDIGDNNAEGAPDDAFLFGIRIAYALTSRLDVEGELAVIPSETQSGTDTVVFGGRLSALMHVVPDGRFRPFVLAGAELTAASPSRGESDLDALIHLGVGTKFQVEDNWGLRADARLLLPPASTDSAVTTDWELLLGVYKSFGTVAPPAPSVPVDTDGDGIMDDADKCPDQPEDKDGFQDEDGCPDLDNDGDGLADDVDQCPDEAEDDNGIDQEDGCPERDTDGDGLVGSQDKCPDQAEDKDGYQDEDGCPDLDNDLDGIADANDKCPNEAETKNGFEDDDGCADTPPAAVTKFTGRIEGIRFNSGSADLAKSSNKVLNAAAVVLKEFPSVRLEIQGHTDSRGSEAMNLDLSQRRADAVKTYLVSQGIDATRLTAKGYGPSVPEADNKSAAGRAKNRRVEFKLAAAP